MESNRPTHAHLGLILHWMLVDIRTMSYEPGNEKWINHLADFAEIIPLQLINRDDSYMDGIVLGLRKWAAKDQLAARYAVVLDMSPQEVDAELCPNRPFAPETVQDEPVHA